jgi:mono/diheme cytochrome c family protein
MEMVWKRIPDSVRVLLVVVVVYLLLKFAIKPPLPFSLIFMYMTLLLIGVVIYITLFFDMRNTLLIPLSNFLGGELKGILAKNSRLVFLIIFPFLIWGWAYHQFHEEAQPPLEQRVIHPAPPGEFVGLYNPYRVEDKETIRRYAQEGAKVYFQNCVFCHGDKLDGKGIFAHGFNPSPADFADPGTIAQLQESFVFWRVSKGGPGLPDESASWNSAMPVWEDMLTQEQRWKAIVFLYWYTGWSPRTWE